MTDRIAKRHKRQVARQKARVKVSEPDLRTPEQVRAAREASRPAASRQRDSLPPHTGGSAKSQAAPVRDSSEKTDV